MCANRILTSAFASTQSDQSRFDGSLGHWLHTECPSKALIRLRGCAGWSVLAGRTYMQSCRKCTPAWFQYFGIYYAKSFIYPYADRTNICNLETHQNEEVVGGAGSGVFLLNVPRRFLCCSSFFLCSSVISCVACLVSFVPHLSFLWCLRKTELRDCGIFWVFSLICFLFAFLYTKGTSSPF